jgi:hypothetical protein
MKSFRLPTLFLALILSGFTTNAIAQNQFDALRFSQSMPSFDPATTAVGGSSVTALHGYSSFLQNPATAGLATKSSFSLGLVNRNTSEDSNYLNTFSTFDDSQTGVSHFGYMYRFPTVQGSLVIGGGYTQTADFNRASSINALNDQHSIVDFYLVSPGDQYFGPAYDTFAIDDDPNFSSDYYNVLRADGNFLGMQQYAELTERGQMGEYSFFMATEFRPNFFLGASFGISAGSYSYNRIFLEEDQLNRYADASYDVDAILTQDKINASLRGVNARIGILYTSDLGLNIGLSHTTGTNYTVDETYSTFMQTDYKTLDDDGFNRYESSFEGEFSYTVRKPSVTAIGVGFTAIPSLSIEASAERINYSAIEMGGFDFTFNRDLNNAIANDFEDVVNLRFGASYNISNNTVLRAGYAHHPSPRKAFDATVNYYTGGVTFKMGEGISFDLGITFAEFNDELNLYQFNNTRATSAQTVEKINGSLGVKFSF